jgi:hypothetical protein
MGNGQMVSVRRAGSVAAQLTQVTAGITALNSPPSTSEPATGADEPDESEGAGPAHINEPAGSDTELGMILDNGGCGLTRTWAARSCRGCRRPRDGGRDGDNGTTTVGINVVLQPTVLLTAAARRTVPERALGRGGMTREWTSGRF